MVGIVVKVTDEDEQHREHLRVYGPNYVKNLTDDQLGYELRYTRTGWWVDEVNPEARNFGPSQVSNRGSSPRR